MENASEERICKELKSRSRVNGNVKKEKKERER